ncbi:hypothetical protein BDD12DRAFT_871565 [Trichophaea hybrida]|nr:hypothetical protein BDD12DRAFT_871565 [Trichophaea hybrida]
MAEAMQSPQQLKTSPQSIGITTTLPSVTNTPTLPQECPSLILQRCEKLRSAKRHWDDQHTARTVSKSTPIKWIEYVITYHLNEVVKTKLALADSHEQFNPEKISNQISLHEYHIQYAKQNFKAWKFLHQDKKASRQTAGVKKRYACGAASHVLVNHSLQRKCKPLITQMPENSDALEAAKGLQDLKHYVLQ